MIVEWRSGTPPKSGNYLVSVARYGIGEKRVEKAAFSIEGGWNEWKDWKVIAWDYLPAPWNGRTPLRAATDGEALAASDAYDKEIRAILAERAVEISKGAENGKHN